MANTGGQKYECPACPACDETFVLPEVSPDELCGDNFVLESSEISQIWIGSPNETYNIGSLDGDGCWIATAADFSIVSVDGGAGTIRPLCVKGDMGLPTANTVEICRQRTVKIDDEYTINFDVDNNTKQNYNFMRGISCLKEVCFWFGTMGCAAYGGPTGISATISAAAPNFQRGKGNNVQYSYSLTFSASCAPPRLYPNPIAV